jgi:hypothetical protein
LDEHVTFAALVQAGFEQLEVVDDGDRRGDSRKRTQKFLQIFDLLQNLPAPEHTGLGSFDHQVERVAANDLPVDGLIGAPHLGVRWEVVEEVGVDADDARAGERQRADGEGGPQHLAPRYIGNACEPLQQPRQHRWDPSRTRRARHGPHQLQSRWNQRERGHGQAHQANDGEQAEVPHCSDAIDHQGAEANDHGQRRYRQREPDALEGAHDELVAGRLPVDLFIIARHHVNPVGAANDDQQGG